MSLAVLVVMVVAGIAAIVLAVHLTGGSGVGMLDEEEARRRFADDHPEIAVTRVILSEDRRTAFLDTERGLGVVHVFGHHRLTRLIGAGDVATASRDGPVLTLRLRDFTWTGGRFTFATKADAATVERLSAGGVVEEASQWTTISSRR